MKKSTGAHKEAKGEQSINMRFSKFKTMRTGISFQAQKALGIFVGSKQIAPTNNAISLVP